MRKKSLRWIGRKSKNRIEREKEKRNFRKEFQDNVLGGSEIEGKSVKKWLREMQRDTERYGEMQRAIQRDRKREG